jgi:hypothetical protein
MVIPPLYPVFSENHSWWLTIPYMQCFGPDIWCVWNRFTQVLFPTFFKLSTLDRSWTLDSLEPQSHTRTHKRFRMLDGEVAKPWFELQNSHKSDGFNMLQHALCHPEMLVDRFRIRADLALIDAGLGRPQWWRTAPWRETATGTLLWQGFSIAMSVHQKVSLPIVCMKDVYRCD